jgi:hypothetical protein
LKGEPQGHYLLQLKGCHILLRQDTYPPTPAFFKVPLRLLLG